jgi:hypothetical protein
MFEVFQRIAFRLLAKILVVCEIGWWVVFSQPLSETENLVVKMLYIPKMLKHLNSDSYLPLRIMSSGMRYRGIC